MQSAFDKKINQNDLYHEPNFLSFESEIPTVITVHDLSWIKYPEHHPKSRVLAMNKFFTRGLKDAQRVVVDSGYIKNEIVSLLGFSEDKIDAIPLGFSEHFKPRKREEVSGVLNQCGLKYQDYFLLVGTIEPRKNITTAIDAFKKLPKRIRKKTPLVLVGAKGWLFKGILDNIQPLINNQEVVLLGYLKFEDLVFLYAGAKAFIFPSVYEGFGLPPLEAMASGIPVIASNTSSVPEVVGEAGILIDPFDVDMFAEAMMNVAEDMSFRDMLAEKSLTRSQLFSWDGCAEKTISTYKKALHN
jgi:alpha-1,3-rhamnosyl/mannosyltransferase